MELIISGDRREEDGVQPGVELWRVPFRGWDEPHVIVAEAPCRPQRYTVVDMGLTRASGPTRGPVELRAGDLFTIEVAEPPQSWLVG